MPLLHEVYWEIMAIISINQGLVWADVALDSKEVTIWIVDAHRDAQKRFVVPKTSERYWRLNR
jgi:hypothetical protein